MRAVRTLQAALAALALALMLPTAALAAGESFAVTDVDRSDFPKMRMQLTWTGDEQGKVPDVTVRENDREIDSVSTFAGKLNQFEDRPRPVVMLAIDTSDSMQGRIVPALAAARALAARARPGDRIGIVAFDGSVRTVLKPTSDIAKVDAALSSMTLSRGTKLFDGLMRAASEFPDDATRRIVVVLTDGADAGSSASLDKVVEAFDKDGIEGYAVGLQGKTFVPSPLQQLAAQTDGRAYTVATVDELTPLYTELGSELLRSYWIEYRSSQPAGADVKVGLEVQGDSVIYSYTTPKSSAASGRIQFDTPKAVPNDKPAVSLPKGGMGLLLATLPFGLLLGMLAWSWIQRRGRMTLSERIEMYTREKQNVTAAERIDMSSKGRSMLAPLFRITDSVLGATSLFTRFRFMLEQANLPLRAVELLYMMLGGLLLGLLFGKVFFGGLFGILIMGGVGGMAPYGWVALKARKRRKLFEGQLPDVLSAVAASLKAGHSFNQSITAIVKETPNPTAEEFQRALGEARLGMPIEQALEAMADRMGSKDFDFAVTTVNIQRTVGGSLSEILDMVADTVRNRQQFRKKVKALTSMGTASAYVLLGMPIFMGLFLGLINPEYMEPLFSTPIGHKMMMVGCGFMFMGYLACKKIVSIKT